MLLNTLIAGCIIGFIGLFAIVVYFRIKVLMAYRKLVNNKIQFETAHVFNRKRLEAEILPRYPEHQKLILTFVTGIRISISMVTVFMIIISVCAVSLMFLSEGSIFNKN